MSSSVPSPRDVGESMTRITNEGRKLTYELRVIQQPERARACGSGAKSSADRRPVDPPPVVELRIFEGENKNDITFSYNANFFLYASLEVARPMAHGRGAPSTSQIPVLTGMPVSGMAYLDRPMEAGYFIFPDLSVRHEGKYKLQFNLYEETKDPKDFDNDEPKHEGAPGQNACFNWRLEVKSAPFTVYSAKKFPGLAESTVLSRTVAEQGCRVRIRRDVRMRRRDGKNSGEFDEEYEEFSRQRTRTPEAEAAYNNRVRSMSNASAERPDPYAGDQSRRPSAVEYPSQAYQSNYAPSSAPSQSVSSANYLAFGAGSAAPQYQAPSQYAQPPAPVQPIQPTQQYQPAQMAYDQAPPTQYRASISGPTHSNYAERPPYQQYSSSAAPTSREHYEQDRRASVGFARAPSSNSHSNSHYGITESSFRNPPPSFPTYSSSKASTSNMPNILLAPLKMAPMEPRYESASSPSVPLSGNRMTAPLPSPFESHSSRSNSYSAYPTALPTPSTDGPRSGGKRTFDAVFSTVAYNQPLHNGMRPSSSHHNGPSPAGSYDEDEDAQSMEELKMQYKRADGTSHARALPNLQ